MAQTKSRRAGFMKGIFLWLSLVLWAVGLTDIHGQAWHFQPLPFNTPDSEVLIGFDGDQLYFSRYAGGGGLKALLSPNFEAAGFVASRAKGFTGFLSEEPMDLMPTEPHGMESLGPIGHVAVDVDRGVMVGSTWTAKGGWDLFVAHRTAHGDWAHPRLLDDLNTRADEVFPNFCEGDIWFGSNRRESQGGFDVFVSRRKAQWQTVEWAPEGVNSPADDIAAVCAGEEEADGFYVCTSRFGGQGASDIGYVGPPTPEVPSGVGFITLEIIHDLEPLAGVEVSVKRHGEGGAHAFRGLTGLAGRVNIGAMSLDAAHDIQVRSVQPGRPLPDLSFLHVYQTDSKTGKEERIRTYRIEGGRVFVFDFLPLDAFAGLGLNESTEDASGLLLSAEAWVVRFPSGVWSLSDRDALGGQQWFAPWADLMRGAWPEAWGLKVVGYADEQGDLDFNDALGLKRAQSVADWIMEQGVPSEYIQVLSIGERAASGLDAMDRRCEVTWTRVGG